MCFGVGVLREGPKAHVIFQLRVMMASELPSACKTRYPALVKLVTHNKRMEGASSTTRIWRVALESVEL